MGQRERWCYKNNWMSFYFGSGFQLSYKTCGYFDPRHQVTIALIFFHLTICLPIRSHRTTECDPPKWGVAYHDQTFWIYRGGKGNFQGGNKWWTIGMPWEYVWVRTSTLRKDGDWEHSRPGNYWDPSSDKNLDNIWYLTVPYTYTLRSGELQHCLATMHVKEWEWRRRWLKWTSFKAKVTRDIEVEFDAEVGESAGSWKGGVIGTSFTLLPGEEPIDCLRRMERDKKFRL